MLIEEYVSEQYDRPDDLDLTNELSTMSRVMIESDNCRDQVSVQYTPDEIVSCVVDEDEFADYHHIPVETTVLVVGEDEVIERDDIHEARFEDEATPEDDELPWNTDVTISANGHEITVGE